MWLHSESPQMLWVCNLMSRFMIKRKAHWVFEGRSACGLRTWRVLWCSREHWVLPAKGSAPRKGDSTLSFPSLMLNDRGRNSIRSTLPSAAVSTTLWAYAYLCVCTHTHNKERQKTNRMAFEKQHLSCLSRMIYIHMLDTSLLGQIPDSMKEFVLKYRMIKKDTWHWLPVFTNKFT